MSDAYLLLEDGSLFHGISVGREGEALGEVVFNTSMTGYQEAVTDPSYSGQIITYTYPLVGNYGTSDEAMESQAAHARAVVMREAKNYSDSPRCDQGWLDWLKRNGVVALSGIDTRALVRHIRDKGAMRGGVFSAGTKEADALERVLAEPPMAGQDLVREVTPDGPKVVAGSGAGPRVAVIDCGIKESIVKNLLQRGCQVELMPASTSSKEMIERGPDVVLLANGPGDPAALDYIVDNVRDVVGKVPVVGICLGHQLLCRAIGLETFKLPFGHRGANHPVKDLPTGRIEITSQNHGFAVIGPDSKKKLDGDEPVRWRTDFGEAELTQINLYDRTVEGLVLKDVAAMAVQYHPEAGPGPHDSLHLFDRFLELAGA